MGSIHFAMTGVITLECYEHYSVTDMKQQWTETEILWGSFDVKDPFHLYQTAHRPHSHPAEILNSPLVQLSIIAPMASLPIVNNTDVYN